jgi:serine/threonine protein kinase
MPLAPGTRLGAYEVTSQIGVGGMGEVYRATDTKLGRQVAIKVLPASVAQDAERLARFDREARTLAAHARDGTWPADLVCTSLLEKIVPEHVFS